MWQKRKIIPHLSRPSLLQSRHWSQPRAAPGGPSLTSWRTLWPTTEYHKNLQHPAISAPQQGKWWGESCPPGPETCCVPELAVYPNLLCTRDLLCHTTGFLFTYKIKYTYSSECNPHIFWRKGKDDLYAEKREPVKHLVSTLAARWTQIQPWISPQCSCCALRLRFIELGKGEKRKSRNRDHFQILLRPWLRGREISRR